MRDRDHLVERYDPGRENRVTDSTIRKEPDPVCNCEATLGELHKYWCKISIAASLPLEYRAMLVSAEDILHKFATKAHDYPVEGFQYLGARGQISDITRKFFKLKANVWDGKQLTGEQAREIAEDLIGHCLILIYCLEAEI